MGTSKKNELFCPPYIPEDVDPQQGCCATIKELMCILADIKALCRLPNGDLRGDCVEYFIKKAVSISTSAMNRFCTKTGEKVD